MNFQIVKSFHSEIEANVYFLKLQDAGLNCFLSSDKTFSMLPLNEIGIHLNVEANDVAKAKGLIEEIDQTFAESKEKEDFTEATMEDIQFEKEVNAYQNPQYRWGGMKYVSIIVLVIFISFVIFSIIYNYQKI